MSIRFESLSRLGLLLLGMVSVASAQITTGAIRGSVTDSAGGAALKVKVQATNLATGETFSVESSEAGVYLLGNLPIGNYKLQAQLSGFRPFATQPVRVETASTTTVDIVLQVGVAEQAITVAATTAPLIQTDTAELSTVIEGKMILDLPLDIGGKTTSGAGSGRRQIEMFLFLTPGITGDGWSKHILGSPMHTNQTIIDGIPFAPQESPGYMAPTAPPFESVEEFKIATTMYSAQVGRGIGISNYTIKSGTNEFHGNAEWFLRNDKLDARGFFNATKNPIRQNEIAFRVGGPVIKNRTFFFASYQDFRKRGGVNTALGTSTIPTPDFAKGDYSQLKDASGALIPIFDPATTTSDGKGGFMRRAFPGNIIPVNRIDPIAAKLFALIPQSDYPGIVNNWANRSKNPVNDRTYAFKGDHRISDAHHLSGSFWHASPNNERYDAWGDTAVAGGYNDTFHTNGWRGNWDWVARPNLLNHFGVGGSWIVKDRLPLSTATHVLSGNVLGIPGIPNDAPGFTSFNLPGYLPLGSAASFKERTRDRSVIGVDSVSWTHGKHSLIMGGEFWSQQFQRYDRRNQGGVFNTSNLSTSQPDSPHFSAWGDSSASLLLGQIYSGDFRINPVPATYNTKYVAAYLEDKYQITPRLTASLGVRYEVPWPIREAENRIAAIDLSKSNPAAGGIPGAYVFGNDAVTPSLDLREWSPRLALAYRLDNKTVIRSGFGLIYAQSNALTNGMELGGNSLLSGYVGEYTPQSQDSGITPALILSNGPDTANAIHLGQSTGNNVNSVADYLSPRAGHAAYTANYNFNIQRELPYQVFVDVGYVGNKGTRLASNLENLDQTPAKYLSLGPLLNASVDSPEAKAAGIGAPYPGFVGSVAQALRPFPQYSGIQIHADPIGNTTYHSFQAKFQKRFSSGLGFLVNYTLSKTITDTGGNAWSLIEPTALDAGNRRLEKALAPFDQTHVVIANFVYELPLTRETTGVKAKVLSGWEVSSTLSYASGTPVSISGGGTLPIFGLGNRPNSMPGVNPMGTWNGNFDPARDRYLNAAAFSQPAPFTFGTLGRTEPNVRLPFSKEEDVSISKRTYISQIREGFNVEFRTQFFNLFNRTVFGGPSSNIDNPQSFGIISSQANFPRSIQMALKVNF
jgi:hypothetical protein